MLPPMLEMLKILWARWKQLAHGLMKAQTAVLVFAAYWVAVGPVGLMTKLTGRDLLDRGKGPGQGSLFLPVAPSPDDLDRAQRQF